MIPKEGITVTPDGLEAIIFTADGDMRQALNNLQVSLVCGADSLDGSTVAHSRPQAAALEHKRPERCPYQHVNPTCMSTLRCTPALVDNHGQMVGADWQDGIT